MFTDNADLETLKDVYGGEPGGLPDVKLLINNLAMLDENLSMRNELSLYLFDEWEMNTEGDEITPEVLREPAVLIPLDEDDPNYSISRAAARGKQMEANDKYMKKLVYLKAFAMKALMKLCSKIFNPVWIQFGMNARACWKYLEANYGDAAEGAAEATYQTISLFGMKMKSPQSFSNFHIQFSKKAKQMSIDDKTILSFYMLKPSSTENGMYFLPPHLDEAKDHILTRKLSYADALEWFIRQDNFWRNTPEGMKWIKSAVNVSDKNLKKVEDSSKIEEKEVRVVKRKFQQPIRNEDRSNDSYFKDMVCHSCSQKGHQWRDCPKLNKRKGDQSDSPAEQDGGIDNKRKRTGKESKGSGSIKNRFKNFIKSGEGKKFVRAIECCSDFDGTSDTEPDEESDGEAEVGNSRRYIRSVGVIKNFHSHPEPELNSDLRHPLNGNMLMSSLVNSIHSDRIRPLNVFMARKENSKPRITELSEIADDLISKSEKLKGVLLKLKKSEQVDPVQEGFQIEKTQQGPLRSPPLRPKQGKNSSEENASQRLKTQERSDNGNLKLSSHALVSVVKHAGDECPVLTENCIDDPQHGSNGQIGKIYESCGSRIFEIKTESECKPNTLNT